jgi:hypothetical protein
VKIENDGRIMVQTMPVDEVDTCNPGGKMAKGEQ